MGASFEVREKLRRDIQQAVEANDLELAARLRDELAFILGGGDYDKRPIARRLEIEEDDDDSPVPSAAAATGK